MAAGRRNARVRGFRPYPLSGAPPRPRYRGPRNDEAFMTHPVFSPGRVAVITGGASGIGLAAAELFASLGLKVCIADRAGERLDAAAEAVRSAGATDVLAVAADVGDVAALRSL